MRSLVSRVHPDDVLQIVNEVSTGGATPLHTCGMSRQGQTATAALIELGATVETLDTYGMTALHRMASNNLPIGAQALLDAGADAQNAGVRTKASPRPLSFQGCF